MTRVEVLSSSSYKKLQTEVNTYLRDNPEEEVVDIKFSTAGGPEGYVYSAMIIVKMHN